MMWCNWSIKDDIIEAIQDFQMCIIPTWTKQYLLSVTGEFHTIAKKRESTDMDINILLYDFTNYIMLSKSQEMNIQITFLSNFCWHFISMS